MSGKPGIHTPCANCGTRKYHPPKRIKEHNFCSSHCFMEYRYSHCFMEYRYSHNLIDKEKQTENAHKAMHEMVDKGEWSLQKPENIVKGHRTCGHRNYGTNWLEEKMGWALTQLGIKFKSQYPIKHGVDTLNRPRYYFPDFAIPEELLLIECDGSYWHNETEDKARQDKLEGLGWNVIRFTDTEINNNLMGCANKVCQIMGVIE